MIDDRTTPIVDEVKHIGEGTSRTPSRTRIEDYLVLRRGRTLSLMLYLRKKREKSLDNSSNIGSDKTFSTFSFSFFLTDPHVVELFLNND